MRPVKPRTQAGFVLIEVLISVLIFAVGVLALVGLQISMTRAQTDSKVRADAANLASELIGMVWSDSKNLDNYNTAACAGQCADWKSKVLITLPQSSVALNTVSATGQVTVTLNWTSPNGDPHKYTTATTVIRNPP